MVDGNVVFCQIDQVVGNKEWVDMVWIFVLKQVGIFFDVLQVIDIGVDQNVGVDLFIVSVCFVVIVGDGLVGCCYGVDDKVIYFLLFFDVYLVIWIECFFNRGIVWDLGCDLVGQIVYFKIGDFVGFVLFVEDFFLSDINVVVKWCYYV